MMCPGQRKDSEEEDLLLNAKMELGDNKSSIGPLKAYSKENFRNLGLYIRIFLNTHIAGAVF